MGGIARIARELGHEVSGSDVNIYPPMSTQLASLDVSLHEGYEAAHVIATDPDLVIIGNALSRGNPAVEAVLDRSLSYVSGAQWLADNVLSDRWVLAVAGTHGKTTSTSMLCWILEHAGLAPGFLVGGVPENFGVSARLGERPFFVIEADEYDTAFFDKRSKFVHYRPRTLILNNLEYDHADIFETIDDIKRQFHHLLRTVPGNGRVIVNAADQNLQDVIQMGCWSSIESFGFSDGGVDSKQPRWSASAVARDASRFTVSLNGIPRGSLTWPLIGRYNMLNGLAAIAAAHHAGVAPETACAALAEFRSVKRRLELHASIHGVDIYDDFAHHPTAIRETLQALRDRIGARRLVCVLEPRSNSMRRGVHTASLADALAAADLAVIYRPQDLPWNPEELGPFRVFGSVDAIVEFLGQTAVAGDCIVIMSNGGFGGLHGKLTQHLQRRVA